MFLDTSGLQPSTVHTHTCKKHIKCKGAFIGMRDFKQNAEVGIELSKVIPPLLLYFIQISAYAAVIPLADK